MKTKHIITALPFLLIMVFFLAALTWSSVIPVVIKAPQSMNGQPLAGLWNWAVEESRSFGDGFWLGYSISKNMSRNSRIGSFGPDNESMPTLDEILSGKVMENMMPSEISDKDAARRALDRSAGREESDEMTTKEVGILFQFKDNPADMGTVQEIEIGNLSVPVDLDEKPLLWLGNVGQEESAVFLSERYEQGIPASVKDNYMTIFGIHTESPSALAFLGKIIRSDESADVREKAVFWLGQHNNREALDFLRESLLRESLGELKKKIIFSISQIRIDGALAALREAAQNNADSGVQEEAIFWLGQRGPNSEVATFLESLLEGEAGHSVKEKAIFSLSQLRDDGGIPSLVNIARKNTNPEIRKKAIFWLGQKAASGKSLPALKEIVEEDPDNEIREQAIFSLSQLPENSGIPALIDIAKNNKNDSLRKKAIFWLSQSGDPRAQEAIIQIVTSK